MSTQEDCNAAAKNEDIDVLEKFKEQGILPSADVVYSLGCGKIDKNQAIRTKVWALLNGVPYDYHLSHFFV